MGLLRSDGLVLATPIGSSGYTASAGGPIVHADIDAIILTPLCPFIKSFSSMVFSPASLFELRIEKSSTDCYLTIDGQEGQLLMPGDEIKVTGMPAAIYFFNGADRFLERLRLRGFVLEQSVAQEPKPSATNEN